MSHNVEQRTRPYFGDYERWIDERLQQADRELSEKIAVRVTAANQRLARHAPRVGHYVADSA
jgi:hypothetical protein